MPKPATFRVYPRRFYTLEQRAWCIRYECQTFFEPVMDDYEAGNQTFEEAQAWNKQWLLDWAKEAVDRL